MKFNKLVIFYFTGTGNALTAAGWMLEMAKQQGLQTEIYPINNVNPEVYKSIDSQTLIGFLYPTHGFNAAPAMLKFLSGFPRLGKAYVFFMNTRAGGKFFKWRTPGLSGCALFLPLLIMFFKGYKIAGAKPLDMPSNWVSLHPGYSKKWVDFIISDCRLSVTKFFTNILEGKRKVSRMCIDMPVDILILPVSIGYYIIGRFMLAKTFIYSARCNSCELCVSNCPVGAIKMVNQKPFWTYKCESCMRCISYCPHKAIQASHLIFAIAVLIFNVPFTLLTIKYIPELSFLGSYLIIFIIDSFISMMFLFALYAIVQRLLKTSFFEAIFRYTSLTNYWRRYHSPYVKTSDFKKK